MIDKKLKELNMNLLTKEQYEKAKAEGTIDEDSFYLTPAEDTSENLVLKKPSSTNQEIIGGVISTGEGGMFEVKEEAPDGSTSKIGRLATYGATFANNGEGTGASLSIGLDEVADNTYSAYITAEGNLIKGIDFNSTELLGIGAPTEPNSAATKQYVDDNGGKIDTVKLNGKVVPIGTDKSVNVEAVELIDGAILLDDRGLGDGMSTNIFPGCISVGGSLQGRAYIEIGNLDNNTYDVLISSLVAGRNSIANIRFNGCELQNIAGPTEPTSVATKGYVDATKAPTFTKGTADLTPGVSELPEGHVYFMYE